MLTVIIQKHLKAELCYLITMSEDKIVLDKKSFSALAVDSRVNILKALRERRKTLTELSGELKLSVSSTKEHLEKLEQAELVVKVEDGHKWKYYELTRKGEQLVAPNPAVRVMVLLGIAVIGFVYSLVLLSAPGQMAAVQEAPATAFSEGASKAADGSVPLASAPLGEAARNASGISQVTREMAAPDMLPILLAVISVLIIIGCIVYILKRRSVSR